jgi:hypothetical protein
MTTEEIVEQFLSAVCDGGTPVAECDLCRKTWYHPEGEYMEPDGEFDRLQARHAREPETCAPAEHAVSIGTAFGHQFVYDCRCEGVQKYARALWDNRHTIMRFYSRMQSLQESEVARDAEAFEKAKGVR